MLKSLTRETLLRLRLAFGLFGNDGKLKQACEVENFLRCFHLREQDFGDIFLQPMDVENLQVGLR